MAQSSFDILKQQQIDLLNTSLGIQGSGYTRYGAAMWLYQNGFMGFEALEAYRICCKLDHDDPKDYI